VVVEGVRGAFVGDAVARFSLIRAFTNKKKKILRVGVVVGVWGFFGPEGCCSLV